MKFFRRAMLTGCLMLGARSVVQDTKPVPVEYNIASCGSHDFTVIHVVLDKDHTKMTFGDFLTGPTSVKTPDEPLVLDYKEQLKSENGIIQFTASTVYEKHKLEIDGARLGNRIIGVLLVDGDLGHAYYGFVGNHDDITVGVEDEHNTCKEIQQLDQEAIAEKLLQFLVDGATKPDTTSKTKS